jgi:general secretion pathway protein I
MKQQGFSLLEVLLAMSIFAAVALTLTSSMQGQINAIDRMHNYTFALWVADSQLKTPPTSDASASKDATSAGEAVMAGHSWPWQGQHDKTAIPTVSRRTVTVMLPNGQHVTLSRYFLPADTSHD